MEQGVHVGLDGGELADTLGIKGPLGRLVWRGTPPKSSKYYYLDFHISGFNRLILSSSRP